ncbi:hypothetical protein [Sulfitobacter pacificus]|uniref:hypothetical protein n=1 Tax=Sulfitobacter pacificus TaxID=1499314 RepID=UPI003102087D
MAYVPMKTEELKKMVMMGKKRPMNFAYNPGPKDEDLMIIDRIKQPDVLGRIAKKEGKGTKVAAGTFELEGKKFSIKVAKELPGLAKKLRKYLKKLDFSFSIEVLDLDGAVLEADLTDEEQQEQAQKAAAPAQDATPEPKPEQAAADQAAPENDGRFTQVQDGKQPEANMPDPEPADQQGAKAADAPDTSAQRAALSERLRALQAPIADLGKSGAPLGKAAGAVVAQIKAGSLDTADATLTKIEAGLAKAQARAAATKDAGKSDQPEQQTQEAKDTPDMSGVTARAAALRSAVDAVQGDETAPIKKTLVQALAAIKAQDVATAETLLSEAETALENLPETPDQKAAEPDENTQAAADENAAEDDNRQAEAAEESAQDDGKAAAKSKKKWEAMSGQVQTSVDAAMQANRGDLDAINRAFNFAKSQADAGEYESAVAAATNTVKLLKAAAISPVNARAQEAADGVPDNVIAYRKSRTDWSKTRSGLQAELTKLKMAIDAQTRGIEGLEDIAQNTEVLFDYIEEIDASLEGTLDALLGTPDGPEREKLKGEAIKIIETYRSTLDNEFFKSVDDNGFTNTAIRNTALTALFGVETALAA